jgi:hypothetical protein
MSLEIRYTGDKITTKVRIKNLDNTYKDLDSISELYVHLYTSSSPTRIVKFSKTDKTGDGYIQMVKVSSTLYTCTIPSATSLNIIPGVMYQEILDVDLTRIAKARVYKIVGDITINSEL